uniref:F-box domain-containing protein n=1 Tax=Romanomermis culicivorax TaxID=13658 RepID=A0A915KN80_ROMCU
AKINETSFLLHKTFFSAQRYFAVFCTCREKPVTEKCWMEIEFRTMKRRRSRSTKHPDFEKSNDENAVDIPDTVISLILLYVNFRDLCNLELVSKKFRLNCLKHYRNLKYVDFGGNRPLLVISRSALNALIDKMTVYAPKLRKMLHLSSIADRFTRQNFSKFSKFSRLNQMDFFRVDVDCAGFNKFLGNATNLRHLSVICVSMKNRNEENFSINVNLPNLEVLELACLQFCNYFLRSLCSTKLRVFRVTQQNNETCSVDLLEQTLGRNVNLEHLNFKDIQYFDYLEYIDGLPNLKRLFIDSQDTPRFGTSWAVPRNRLENSNFDEFKMNFENSFSARSVFLPANSCCLTVLKYSKNLKRLGFHVFHTGMDAIWSQLAVKNSLETIFISQHCPIAYPIFGILQQLPNLRELVLSDVVLLEHDIKCLSNFNCLTRIEFKNVTARCNYFHVKYKSTMLFSTKVL